MTIKQTILTRVSPQVKERLKAEAKREGRSLSAHVAILLAQSLAELLVQKK